MSLLSNSSDIFDIFQDFDDRFSKRMKRFKKLANRMFMKNEIDPFFDLFEEQDHKNQKFDEERANSINNTQAEKLNSSKKQEIKQQNRIKNQEFLQQIKREKQSIFDLFAHYDKLFNQRMKKFDYLTEKMFEKLGHNYIGQEIVDEKKSLDQGVQNHLKGTKPNNNENAKQQEQNQTRLQQENNTEQKENQQKAGSQGNVVNYRSPFDLFSDFDKVFKKRIERFEKLTDMLFEKFEPQFIDQEKQKQNSNEEQNSKDNDQRRRSQDLFFRPFRFIDDIASMDNEMNQENFSKNHLKLMKENKVDNQPSMIYNKSYSCVQKLDKDGKQVEEVKSSSEYTERDEKGRVITKGKHFVKQNGNEMEIEERMVDGKGVKKIVSKGQDGKCEEKTLLHNLKSEEVQDFNNNWIEKNKENNIEQKESNTSQKVIRQFSDVQIIDETETLKQNK